MRYVIATFGLIAASTTVAAQEAAAPAPEQASNWQFVEDDSGRKGASVEGDNGTQLVLKCDKAGSREVHAILLSPNNRLAVPNARPVSRPIRFQFDGGSPKTESWGFYAQHAIAHGKSSDRALARLINGLRDASKVTMRLDTGISQDVEMAFDVTGAREAIAKVYEMCKDRAPA